MMKMKVDLKAFLVENWCHGVLSFDLKIGGIPESHKSNQLNVDFFREIFETKPKIYAAATGELQSPNALIKK